MYKRQAKKFCNPCLLEGQELKDAEPVKCDLHRAARHSKARSSAGSESKHS